MSDELTLRSAVVTGPTGAVGTALIEELVGRGVEVAAVCRPGSARIAAVPSHPLVKIVECGADEYGRLPSLLEGKTFEAFYHFAWDGTFGPSRLDYLRQERNVTFTLEAVQAAHELGCQVFVGAGSQSEFGHVEGVLHPDAPCNPDNAYGAAKLAASIMSRALCGHLGIRHEWCRIVSLFGKHDGAYTLIMTCISKLLAGEHLACTNGDQVWDYIYSKDAARAFRLIAEKGKNGAVYLLGTGKVRLLHEYVESIRDLIDPAAQVGFGEIPYYPNQAMHLEADISNLTADTGFTPRYSFEDGIKETIEWFKEENNCIRKMR